MKARVDQEACIGCELCTQICPQVFRMEGDKAAAYVEIVPEKEKERALKAAEECPVNAITVK